MNNQVNSVPCFILAPTIRGIRIATGTNNVETVDNNSLGNPFFCNMVPI